MNIKYCDPSSDCFDLQKQPNPPDSYLFVKHHYKHVSTLSWKQDEHWHNISCCHRPGVVQLPALSVVILLQAFEPVCGLTQPAAVQQVLKGRGHVQVLVNGEGHAVVKVVEKVVGPHVDRAHWVVHGYLKSKRQSSSKSFVSDSFLLRQ